MKVAACSAVALLAIVGLAVAQNFNNFNNFGNDDGFFGNDDGFFGNDDGPFDDDNSWAFGGAGVSGLSSGGSWGSSFGGSFGHGGGMVGFGQSPVSYIPLPVQGKSGGVGSLVPLLLFIILIPLLFNNQATGSNVVLVNNTSG